MITLWIKKRKNHKNINNKNYLKKYLLSIFFSFGRLQQIFRLHFSGGWQLDSLFYAVDQKTFCYWLWMSFLNFDGFLSLSAERAFVAQRCFANIDVKRSSACLGYRHGCLSTLEIRTGSEFNMCWKNKMCRNDLSVFSFSCDIVESFLTCDVCNIDVVNSFPIPRYTLCFTIQVFLRFISAIHSFERYSLFLKVSPQDMNEFGKNGLRWSLKNKALHIHS